MSSSPPSLATEFTEATNPTTQALVQMAAAKAAQDISSEPTSTPGHTQRVNLASQVARTPQMYAVPFTTLVCAQGITSQSADTDIANMVSAVWDVMAGVGTGMP